jgi:hypothetical protein
MLVFADEFRFSASRRALPAGVLRLQLKNIGEDDHDLRILGPRGGRRAETGIVEPDGLGEIRTRLGRGRYTFFCTVADHAASGMRFTVNVTRRPPR